MATETRERDFVIDTKQGVVQPIDLRQEVIKGGLGTLAVQVPSGDQKPCRAFGSHIVAKVLVRFAKRLAAVYDLLVAPPATERGRVENEMVKAKHDRFSSFLR